MTHLDRIFGVLIISFLSKASPNRYHFEAINASPIPPNYANPPYPTSHNRNLLHFSIPQTQSSDFVIPVSMSMSASGQGQGQHYYASPPPPRNLWQNNIRLLQPQPQPGFQAQSRILNSPRGHVNQRQHFLPSPSSTKYLELNLSHKNDPREEEDLKGRSRSTFSKNPAQTGIFSPSYGSGYGSRAGRGEEQQILPFLTSTFYKDKKVSRAQNQVLGKKTTSQEMDWKKNPGFLVSKQESDKKKNGFVPSPQVNVEENEGDDGGDDGNGWVGLDGGKRRLEWKVTTTWDPNSVWTTRSPTVPSKSTTFWTFPDKLTSKTTVPPTTPKPTTRKPGNDTENVTQSPSTTVRTIGTSLKTNKPGYTYKPSKLRKSLDQNETSSSTKSTNRPAFHKGIKSTKKSSYAQVKNATMTTPKNDTTQKQLVHLVLSQKVQTPTNLNAARNMTKTPEIIPKKTGSASKIPGVPTTTAERGTRPPTIRNSRTPEIPSDPGSKFKPSPTHNLEQAPQSLRLVQPHPQPQPTHFKVNNSTKLLSKYPEPKPSPEQILQFTPNDIRPSFQLPPKPVSNLVSVSLSQNFQTFTQPRPGSKIIFPTSHPNPTPSQTQPRQRSTPPVPNSGSNSIFSTSIPILNGVRLGRMASNNHDHHYHPLFYPPRQPRHDPNHTQRRMLMPTPSSRFARRRRRGHGHGQLRLRPRRMTLPYQAPSQSSSDQFSSRSLDLGRGRGSKSKKKGGGSNKTVKKGSAGENLVFGDGWLPFSFSRRKGTPDEDPEMEDDSEEELGESVGFLTDREGHPIVDPQHPVVQNALNPLGNPARQPDQLIKKHTKILDPSSLVPMDKRIVVLVIAVGWMVIFWALFNYRKWGKKHGARFGVELEDEYGVSRPLLLDIPQDQPSANRMDPFVGSGR